MLPDRFASAASLRWESPGSTMEMVFNFSSSAAGSLSTKTWQAFGVTLMASLAYSASGICAVSIP